jgi:hypothetical protein
MKKILNLKLKGTEGRVVKRRTKTGSVTSDAYYKFENKFLRSKILESFSIQKKNAGAKICKNTEEHSKALQRLWKFQAELQTLPAVYR